MAMAMAEEQRYRYTVATLLEDAGRRRSQREGDHVVELQLVVAALNQLPDRTYRSEDWQRRLVDFFDGMANLQLLPNNENEKKGRAVQKFILGKPLNDEQHVWIQQIRDHWGNIRQELRGFHRFINSLNEILAHEL